MSLNPAVLDGSAVLITIVFLSRAARFATAPLPKATPSVAATDEPLPNAVPPDAVTLLCAPTAVAF